MANELSAFEPVPNLDDVFEATKDGLRCTAIRLRSGRLCLYSPVAGIGGAARDSLDRLGEVEILLAPNQYHNKALTEYAVAFPMARLLAPSVCHTRLTKITGLTFEGLDALAEDLPDNARLVSPEGLKTGEVWIVMGRTLVVTDAFAGTSDLPVAATLLKTFPRYGVQDKDLYRTWIADFFGHTQIDLLLPCHGHMVQGAHLPTDLIALTERML